MSKLSNALNVMRSFGTTRGELSVTQLAAELQMPKSSVSRLLKEMREQDLLTQDPVTRRFRPGFFLYQLGNIYEDNLPLFKAVLEQVHGLVRETGHIGFVGVVDKGDMVALRTLPGRHTVRYDFRAGKRMPAYAITGGMCVLARMQDSEIAALYGETLDSPYPNAPKSRSELMAEIARIRETGWSQMTTSSLSNVRAIGTSVGTMDGRELYGFSLSFLADDLSEGQIEELRAKLVTTARTLGSYSGDPFWASSSMV